jgi:chromosome segregation ATPase
MSRMLLLDSGREPRSASAEEVVMDEPIQVQVARLESDVRHIQTDVADIKVDLRRIDGRLESIDANVHQLDSRVYQVEQRLTEKIDGVRTDLTEKIDGVRIDLTAGTVGLRADLTEKINAGFEAVHKEISSLKVWALLLYFGLSGSLLFVMAKGFKWL